MSMKTCAVIIVTHNSEIHIPKAIECLKQQTFPASRVIIVDSGSSNTDYLLGYKNESNVELIMGHHDIGFCKGNNIGLEKVPSHYDYVFFLNPDAFVTPRFLEDSVNFLEKTENQHYGALTGTVLGYDIQKDKPTDKYDSTGIFRTWYGRWYDRGQGLHYNESDFKAVESIPAICGAVFFCRKKALDDVLIRGKEVMDNTFFMYKEDIDLSLRLRRNGWSLAFVPNFHVYHCRGWNRDRSKMPREFRLCSARNELRIQARSLSPIPFGYSLLKYASVRLFNL